MKTAKKVLSIVLAAMLLLGTIPFAASAYDFTDGQKAYYSLKAEVFDADGAAEIVAYGGEAAYKSTKPTTAQKANQKNDFAAYAEVEDHVYADKSKAIAVKPGQVVWVTFGLKTTGGLYPTLWESAIGYSSMFLSITNNAKCIVNNPDSEYIGTMCGTATANYWALMPTKTREKFSDGTNHAYAINFDVDYSADSFEDLDEDIYAVPFYVSPSATVGTTGKIFMLKETSSWYSYVAGFEDGDLSTDPFEIFGDYLDYSNATLNFVVVGDGLDYTALDEQIDAFEALTEADYTTDSWAAAEAAYDDAVAIKDDEDATQDDVDAAAEALEDAITALVAATKLNYAPIDTAIALVPADLTPYTSSTVTAVNNAVTAANAAKTTATTQAEIDTAAANLTNAIDALVLKADMTALNAALADAAKADTTYWTQASKDALNNAVTAGQAIVAQAADYSDTAAVASATAAINNALANYKLNGADYTAVDAAIASVPADLSGYTTASVAAVNNAVAAVVRGYDATQQAAVDTMAANITAAVNGLKALANTTALEAAVAAAGAANQADYATATWTAINGYVADAANYIGKGLAAEDAQTAIDTLTANLNAALNNKLGEADYTVVDTAIAAVPADLTPYTADTVAAVNNAVAAVVRGYKADKQAEVNAMADAINNAVAALAIRKADLTALNAAIAAVPADLSNYTADSVAAVNDAKSAAAALVAAAPDYTAQGDVDAATATLNNAVAALTYLGANFSAIDALVADANALVRANYTDASLTAFDTAFASTLAMYNNKADYDITDQTAIDAQATTGAAAFNKLVLKGADFTEIDNLVNAVNELVRDNYTADSIAAFDTAIASTLAMYNNKDVYDITEQDEVDAVAGEGEAAFRLLVLDAADYTMTNRVLGQIAALNADDYTVASWTALQDLVAATPMDLTKDKQSVVDDNEMALRAAKKALVLAAAGNYTAVNAAIAEFNGLDKTIYTDESVAAVDEAIAAVVTGLNENHQSEIDAMAAAINEAIDGLVEKTYDPADYTAVDAAIAAFNGYNQALYTTESVQAVKDAIAAVVRGYDERKQDDVDAMAEAINNAIAALELLPEPEGMVVAVNYTETAELTKTYEVKVEGRAWKIRFVDAAGNTITFSRTDTPEIITSYTEDGKVCDNMARELAYEIWTVTLTIKDGTYTVIARESARGWEAADLGYTLNVISSTKNIVASEMTVNAETAKLYEQLPVTVKTGKDVLKIQLIVNGKEYMVFDKSYATADGDTLVFNAYVKLYTKGANTITAKIKTANGWTETDLSATVEGVK